jgi:hypothetical protein
MRPTNLSVCLKLRQATAICAVALAPLAVGAGSAVAAPAPAPAWKLTAIAAPTNFTAGETGTNVSGPMYRVEATNVGGAPTSGPISLQVSLPDGVTPTLEANCPFAGQVVTCIAPGPVQPGETVASEVVVDTEVGISGSVVAEAMVSGGGAAPSTAVVETAISSGAPSFGFLQSGNGLSAALTEVDGSPSGLAGSHPYQLTFDLGFPSRTVGAELVNSGHPRDVVIDLPPGLIVDPTAPPLCTEAQLVGSACPAASQVGVVTLVSYSPVFGFLVEPSPLYNLVPPPGSASNFGFEAAERAIFIHVLGSVRAGDYGLSAAIGELLARFPIFSLRLQLWGDPSSPSHNAARGVAVPPLPRALITLPSSCGPLATVVRADSWEDPGAFVERGVENEDLEGNPVGVSGCNELGFAPVLQVRPTTPVADSPSGLDVSLEVPQIEAPSARATANLRRVEVTLPEGLVANPAGANGLAGCSPTEIGLVSPVGSGPARFDGAPATCPDPARIGSAQIETPLVDHLLQGSVFLATPHDNPFASLLALYVTAEDERSGVAIKLAGEVEADAATGRLTASFDRLPQLPIADVELRIFDGATAPLHTPAACGLYSTTSSLTPWSAPESGPPAIASDSYQVASSPATGSACARSEAALPSSSTFDAGTVSPAAGAQTPFVLSLKRDDGTQQISSTTLAPPPGLVASLAGVPYCPDAALATATGKPGRVEAADPSCPPASRVGGATVGAGAGPSPYYVGGQAYLAGPYMGAPLSLAIVAPAVAGPFDLGSVVLRSALRVDPRTARVTAVSDPWPQIMRGILLDRPGFIRNPTSCDPMAVEGRAVSPSGDGVSLSDRFQVGECRRLGFAPKVSVRLLGPTHRGAHPRLRTALTVRPGDAGIRRLAVTLPGTELLDTGHIGAVCSREQFAAERCPAGSIQGHARAFSPLLDRPLEGPVYLRASDTRLPGLAVSLDGQVDIDLGGRIDSIRGRLRTTFQALPDVPLTKVVLTMRGGSRGLLVNSGGLCAAERRAQAGLLAHNGKLHDVGPVIGTDCGKAGRKRTSPEVGTPD